MPVYLIGLNSKSHNISEREKYVLSNLELIKKNESLINSNIVKEIVTLSTCNRLEHYVYTENNLELIIFKLFNQCNLKLQILKNNLASYHLFRVASGLESEILGENEILGQLKTSYKIAYTENHTSKNLNTLFQKAISVGKKVRTLTNLSKYSISTGGIIINKIKSYFTDLSKLNILLVGAGNISKSIAFTLYNKGFKNMIITNRNSEKGKILAEKTKAKFIELINLYKNTKEADIIISSTSSSNYLFEKQHENYLHSESKKLIFDLAVPRNFDPYLSNHPNVELFNIDSINNLSNKNKLERKKSIEKAEYIITFENCCYCLNRFPLIEKSNKKLFNINNYKIKKHV